jgi:anti-sigma regulatory factor (Ser/Thr protein kinase)
VASSRLSVARDPALALIVRIFVGAVMERWGVAEPARGDLRLAASELFSGAVEAGEGDLVSFELAADDNQIELRAEGVVPGEAAQPDDEGWSARFDLIRALFPDAEIGNPVRIRIPVPA